MVSLEENILLQNNRFGSQIVDATLKGPFLCDHVEVMKWTANLRLLTKGNSDEREFAEYLLDVGNGNISVEQSLEEEEEEGGGGGGGGGGGEEEEEEEEEEKKKEGKKK
ncbi:Hypothetical predicted protein [Octopus vulgaris]|uniref:Uncharacterized protein n=1 Tax=Octopus vulgaris TaxID=6645 RepID=A0AA36AXD0_OCTVU|nr:Hypothetical predicted protein [Octopus vulgaris]